MARKIWEPEEEPKISNVTWALAIGALMIVDLVQIGLNLLFGAGLAINRFIAIPVGFFFGLWLQMTGQSFSSARRSISFISTFVLEEIPLADFIPWWTIEGFYNRHLERRREAGKSEGALKAVGSLEGKSKGTPTAGVTRRKKGPASPAVDAIKAKT